MTEDIRFVFKNRTKTKEWIKNIILIENKTLGNINFIFTSDAYLQELNVKYLKHNTLTDVITFNDNDSVIINGDIFISVERVKENSVIYMQTFIEELKRVIIHGVLHLLLYNDKLISEKKRMREMEDKCLKLFPN